jgi:hypothetical protein
MAILGKIKKTQDMLKIRSTSLIITQVFSGRMNQWGYSMTDFRSVEGYYQPIPLTPEQQVLFSKHLEVELALAEVRAQHDISLSIFRTQKLDAIRHFLALNTNALGALASTPALQALIANLNAYVAETELDAALDTELDIEASVRACMKVHVQSDDSINSFLSPTMDLDTHTFPLPNRGRDAAVAVARLFKPLMADIKTAYEPVADAEVRIDQLSRRLDNTIDEKKKQSKPLKTKLLEAVYALRSASHGLYLNNSALPRLIDEVERANFSFDACVLDPQNPPEIHEIFAAHRANLALINENLEAARADFHHRKTRFLGRLRLTIGALAEKLPEDSEFDDVRHLCTSINTILNTPDVMLAQLNDLMGHLHNEDLDSQMRAAYFHKDWSQCEGLSDMAGYVMHAIESAIRWCLAWIYICSSTSKTEMTRENYFFKGPEQSIKSQYDSALDDLRAIETLLALEADEIEARP